MTLSKQKILTLSRTFAINVLKGECLKGKCFTTCYPLSIHLENKGENNTIVMGKYKGDTHYWILLNDNETIVDPTIQQFEKDSPPVFIGKNLNGHYDGEKVDNYDSAIHWWKLPFSHLSCERERKFIPSSFEEKINLNIILRAATIIFSENKEIALKNKSALPRKTKVYFDNIFEILRTDKNKKLITDLKPFLPKEFENLLLLATNNSCADEDAY